MTEPIFDHDRLDVYRLSIEYVAAAFDVSKSLNGLHRHARAQGLRAAQSIPLNDRRGQWQAKPKRPSTILRHRTRFVIRVCRDSRRTGGVQRNERPVERRAEANVETYRVDVDPHGDEV